MCYHQVWNDITYFYTFICVCIEGKGTNLEGGRNMVQKRQGDCRNYWKNEEIKVYKSLFNVSIIYSSQAQVPY